MLYDFVLCTSIHAVAWADMYSYLVTSSPPPTVKRWIDSKDTWRQKNRIGFTSRLCTVATLVYMLITAAWLTVIENPTQSDCYLLDGAFTHRDTRCRHCPSSP